MSSTANASTALNDYYLQAKDSIFAITSLLVLGTAVGAWPPPTRRWRVDRRCNEVCKIKPWDNRTFAKGLTSYIGIAYTPIIVDCIQTQRGLSRQYHPKGKQNHCPGRSSALHCGTHRFRNTICARVGHAWAPNLCRHGRRCRLATKSPDYSRLVYPTLRKLSLLRTLPKSSQGPQGFVLPYVSSTYVYPSSIL